MKCDLYLRFTNAQARASASMRRPLNPVRPWSVTGQLVTMFRSALADGEVNEYLTVEDLRTRFSELKDPAILEGVCRGIEAHVFVFRQGKLLMGPAIDLATFINSKARPRNGVRPNSSLDRYLIKLKSESDKSHRMSDAPCESGDFQQFAAYPLAQGLIEIVFVGGIRHVRATKKLLEDSKFPTRDLVAQGLYDALDQGKKYGHANLRNLNTREFNLLYDLANKHRDEYGIEYPDTLSRG